MVESHGRTESDWADLCRDVKAKVPSEIGKDSWEVITAAALIASPQPELLAQFYLYLIQHDPSFATEDEKRRLILRFRDTLLKLITLVGAPQVLCAVTPLAAAEGQPEVKAQTSVLSSKWQDVDVEAIHARGNDTINTIYGNLLPKIFQTAGDHTQDLQFNLIFGVYGLYLSDLEVMTAVEIEAVVFTTVSCIGLRSPSLWHTRGMGRLFGARGTNEDTEEMRKIKDNLRALKTAMISIVEWVGEEYIRRANLGAWVNVGDVIRELGGWGDDEAPK